MFVSVLAFVGMRERYFYLVTMLKRYCPLVDVRGWSQRRHDQIIL